MTLLETAGRELLAFEQIVGERTVVPSGGSLPNSFGADAGAGRFGGGAGRAAAAATTGLGFGGVAGSGEEEQQDVVRLCAVMEVTSVLLCTLSIALSQVCVWLALFLGSIPTSNCYGGTCLVGTTGFRLPSGISFLTVRSSTIFCEKRGRLQNVY